MMTTPLFTQNVVACIWDFDQTLIPGYMQEPLFQRYSVDGAVFWEEVKALPGIYRERGYNIRDEILYLNHLLSYVRNGPFKGLNNRILKECGREIPFYPGLPRFFSVLKDFVASLPEYRKHDLRLEHYIASTGLAEMIRGSAIAPYVDGIYGCEFIENPLPPGFLRQKELPMETTPEIGQISMVLDNTTKTRVIFEINKGTNRNPAIDVNANIRPEDRRIPFQNMIYIADGPSDIPVFSVVKRNGGKTFAVYRQGSISEFEQVERLLQIGRIHACGPARYEADSSTSMWLKMHLKSICDRIVRDRETAVAQQVSRPPRHLVNAPEKTGEDEPRPRQTLIFEPEDAPPPSAFPNSDRESAPSGET